ncbi:MAG: hypothetical protein AAF808_18410, partial [Cyanobacteria bacterium P01_D01_bin.2]
MFGAKILTTLGQPQLDRLGDLNPQLLRELRGRLKRFPVLAAVILSVLCQLIIMISFWVALPGSVLPQDLGLSTYPKIEWYGNAQMSTEPLQDVLPLDMPHRDKALTVGIVIDRIIAQPPVKGDEALGLKALDQIQKGDRLTAIDGQPVTLSEGQLAETNWQPRVSDLALQINEKIIKHPNTSLTPKVQNLVGTTVELELYRPERGQFTVTLPRVAVSRKYSRYCLNAPESTACDVTPDKQSYRLNWARWYKDIYLVLTIVMVFPLMGGGMFMLANNLADEKRRGTLNFLQLSPRSSFNILSGKLLGVPVCLYLAIGLTLPLHGFLGLGAGHSLAHMLGFDLILIAQSLIFYLLALLLSLSVSHPVFLGLQPWLLAAGVTAFNWMLLLYVGSGGMLGNTQSNAFLWSLLFSPFASLAYFAFETPVKLTEAGVEPNLALGIFRVNFAEYVVLTLTHALGWCALLGHSLQRRFSNAHNTLLKRRFSYPLTLVFATIVLGLTGTRLKDYDVGIHLVLITLLGLVYCIAMMVALSPARQTLKDWARFRHATPRAQRLSLWQDLVIGDNSSPVVAIALNLLLLTGLVVGAFTGYYGDFLGNKIEALIFV